MALTYPTRFSQLATGLLKGRIDLCDRMNSGFVIPGGSQGGVVYVDVLGTVTTETPSAGTFLAEGASNTLTALTLTHKTATHITSLSQLQTTWQDPVAQRALAEKFADGLAMAMQAQIIASLKAATFTSNSTTTSTTFIDFVVPATTTTASSVIKNVLQPVSRSLAAITANKVGAPLSDFWITTTPTGLGNLLQLKAMYPGSVPLTGGYGGRANFQFEGVDIFPLTATNFGGAGKEAMFIGHKEAFAFKHSGIQPYRGGVPVADGDGQYRQSYYVAYAYGVANEALMAEIVNPAS